MLFSLQWEQHQPNHLTKLIVASVLAAVFTLALMPLWHAESLCYVCIPMCITLCLVLSQDLRRRLRYLSHLPLTCEFVMAELDLRPPTVSQLVLDTFKGILWIFAGC